MMRLSLCLSLWWATALVHGCVEAPSGDDQAPGETDLGGDGDDTGADGASTGDAADGLDTARDPGDPFDVAPSLARYEAWRDEMEAIRAGGQIPGVGLVVVEDGAVRHSGGLGVKRDGGADPVTGQTRFRVASISKSVTAAAVLSLVAEGRVALDTPVFEQLPDFGAVPQDWAERITPRQLLNHTAGYPNYPAFFYEIDDAEFAANDELHLFLSLYTDEFFLEFEPGTQWSYSNFGYAVLGWLATDKHGADFEQTMRERVFEPFSMGGATFVFETATLGDYASGHISDDDRLVVLDYELSKVQAPFASLLLSADELGAFMVAILARKDQTPWSEMFQDSLPDGMLPAGQGMGLGLFVTDTPTTASHSGATGGFFAYMLLVPQTDLGVAFAINSDDGDAFGQMLSTTVNRFAQ